LKYNIDHSMQDLAQKANEEGKPVWQVALEKQIEDTGESELEIRGKMTDRLNVMRQAIQQGLNETTESASGLSGKNTSTISNAIIEGKCISNGLQLKMIRNALAASEVNARMGRIVAAPTAGSSGVIPAVLITVADDKGYSNRQLVEALFTAAAIGQVIENRASLSGAESGCQAECGSAAGMGAAALVELAGGSPQQVVHACALAIKSLLGLVCDPVAGYVEVPCIKRNAFSAIHALAAADMALAGITSYIPPDEVIDAMKSVGMMMHPSLKETASGGLADTPKARLFSNELK
jgi:L-serine dehydratase